MKSLLACTVLWALSRAAAQPCALPAPAVSAMPGQPKALAAPALPEVRLRLELRGSLPSPAAETVVSTRPAAGHTVLTLWTDNQHAVEARMALQASSPQGALQWVWSAQQGVAVTPTPLQEAPQARWWFCPTWPGGTGLVRVRYEIPAQEASHWSPERPALKGQISVALDRWVPLWAPQSEPPANGGGTVIRSTQAAPLPRLDMRWRRE